MMTTKYKIIFGFICMIAIILVVSTLGYQSMRGSLVGLGEYRRSVRITVALGNTMAHLNMARSQMNRYLSGRPDKKIIEEAQKAVDGFIGQTDAALQDMVKQENKDIAQKIRALGLDYKKNLAALDADSTALYGTYDTEVEAAGLDIAKSAKILQGTAVDVDNVQVLAALGDIWNEYSSMASALGRYLTSRAAGEMETVRQHAASIAPQLEKIGGIIISEKGRENHGQMLGSFKTVLAAIAEMESAAKATDAALAAVRELHENIFKDLAQLQANFDAQMRTLGAGMTAEIGRGESVLFGGGIAGIVVGLLLSLFIIYGLIRVLREAGNFAGAVARGDFTYAPKIKERGEIGAMLAAMRQIPAVLNQFGEKTGALTNDILSGYLRNRLDASGFSGSFADLAKAVNETGDAYIRIIDHLGVPMMCCDSNFAITFLSEPAQQAVGGNFVGRSCPGELKADSCNSDTCFGKCAMARNDAVHGETTIHPRGQTLEVTVAAVPLYNKKNEVAGFMEVLNDITEIKATQANITRVAQEAEAISVRVASASEEVSIQVKEITRGADMQRDRVGSTATAMTEMNATVLEVARNAGAASEQIEGTRVKAQQGAELVNQVMVAINAVNAVGQNLQGNMQELGKQAENIGSVMNVISDIADQTNLLALNAAIEAARAGEAGRGFAVVADEVRKLAEKTMQATQEVGSSIRAVQQSARVNIDEVGKAVASVAEANTLANSSGEALTEIVSMAASNSAVVASIATAAEEQSATSEEINRAIDEISKIVSETVESMEQSTSAVQTLSSMAQELRRVMDGLR